MIRIAHTASRLSRRLPRIMLAAARLGVGKALRKLSPSQPAAPGRLTRAPRSSFPRGENRSLKAPGTSGIRCNPDVFQAPPVRQFIPSCGYHWRFTSLE
jgi:hypothetical protein